MFTSAKEKNDFLDNLTMLLSSGMDMLTALSTIRDDTDSKSMQKSIDTIINKIDNGSPFWRAMADAKFFPQRTLSLIKIGEETGKLPDNLALILDQQEKERSFRSKIQTALIYPGIVTSLIIVVGSGVGLFILPQLAMVFSSLNVPLPIYTKILIGFGTFLGTYGIFLIPLLLIGLLVTGFMLFVNPKTKILGEKLLLLIPGMRSVIVQIELSRCGYIIGNTLNAGITIVPAIELLEEATTFQVYKNYYKRLKATIEEGNSFQKSMSAQKMTKRLFPRSVQQMIFAAEKSGKVPETFLRIGRIYEQKADVTTKNIAVSLEPILLIIIGIGVFAVAIAVILPIYNLIGTLSSNGQPVVPNN